MQLGSRWSGCAACHGAGRDNEGRRPREGGEGGGGEGGGGSGEWEAAVQS